MATEMSSRVHFRLLENGLDFIRSSLESLRGNPGKRDLKYAVIHLSSGVELILKERLRREHWSLVFDKPENASKNKYETGDFTSASFNACLDRVIQICGVNAVESHRAILNTLRDKRNRLEHFGILDTVEALTADAAATIGFVLDFVESELALETLTTEEKASLEEIRRRSSEFRVFVSKRLESIKEELLKLGSLVLRCPSCSQKSMFISKGARCLFCGYQRDAEGSANDYIADVLFESGEDWPLYTCPVCQKHALVDEGYSENCKYVCFECGKTWNQDELQLCTSCESLYKSESESCPVCQTKRDQ